MVYGTIGNLLMPRNMCKIPAFGTLRTRKFPPDRKNLDGIIQGNSPHAIEVAKQFMATNKIYAHKNFGKHADNMCLVVCQIWKEARPRKSILLVSDTI